MSEWHEFTLSRYITYYNFGVIMSHVMCSNATAFPVSSFDDSGVLMLFCVCY